QPPPPAPEVLLEAEKPAEGKIEDERAMHAAFSLEADKFAGANVEGAPAGDVGFLFDADKPAAVPPDEGQRSDTGAVFEMPADLVQQADEGAAEIAALAAAGFADFTEAQPSAPPAETINSTLAAATDDRATRTVAALEQWLAAIHVPREPRHP